MHESNSWKRKAWKDRRIYPTYEPYPVSDISDDWNYSSGEDFLPDDRDTRDRAGSLKVSGHPDSPLSFPLLPPESCGNPPQAFPGPLRMLESLFSERLDFFNLALCELEGARKEREKLTSEALGEIDSEIGDCERALSFPLLIVADERRMLERRLSELKRERGRQKISCWRDLVWLRAEIRKLKKQISSTPVAVMEKTSGDGNG